MAFRRRLSLLLFVLPLLVLLAAAPWSGDIHSNDNGIHAHNGNHDAFTHVTGNPAGHGAGSQYYAYAHSMFNSAEKFESGYRVQVATAPEFPQIGEPSQFLIRVTDADFEEVDRFRMGIKFFFNDQLVDAIPPTSIDGGHWDFEYVWRNQGNHIVEIYLYNMRGSDGMITYKFNMGTQSPFGYIFIIAITVGAFCFAGVMVYIYLPHMRDRVMGRKTRRGGGPAGGR